MNDDLKILLKLAAELILTRRGDVSLSDGDFATVDVDAILRLDYALSDVFALSSDGVEFENIEELIGKIEKI